jgi:hypothetical protein
MIVVTVNRDVNRDSTKIETESCRNLRRAVGYWSIGSTGGVRRRTWCAEATGYAGEVAEAALAHVKGDRVEAAYQRGDFFEKRRRLMDDWAAFCARPQMDAEIVPLRRAAAEVI